jgi:hypothetical protein
MYRITPSWAMTPRYGATESGSRNSRAAGASQPSSDGPRTMPATTSPMTGGWPSQAKPRPSSRPATITAASASRTCSSASSWLLRWPGVRPGTSGAAGAVSP